MQYVCREHLLHMWMSSIRMKHWLHTCLLGYKYVFIVAGRCVKVVHRLSNVSSKRCTYVRAMNVPILLTISCMFYVCMHELYCMYRSCAVSNTFDRADTYKLPAAAAKLDLLVWIDIEIRKLDWESFTVQVEAHDCIWDAKSRIGAKVAIGPERQVLILDQTM